MVPEIKPVNGERESTYVKKFDDAPSVYFIPQIPNMGDYYRWWQKAKQFAWEKMLRLAFVSGKINPNKVYFSEYQKADTVVNG